MPTLPVSPSGVVTIRHALVPRGRRIETWRDPIAMVGLHHRVQLVCGHWAAVPVHQRSGSAECAVCTEAAQRELARQERTASPQLVRMRAARMPAYAAERARLERLEAAHHSEVASGRPGAGVD